MDIKYFRDRKELLDATADLLVRHFEESAKGVRGIMLSGGNTPLPAYARIAEEAIAVPDDLYLFLSDERMVRVDDKQSNYGQCSTLFSALGLDETRALRVQTDRPLDEAAKRYHEDLTGLLQRGRITLGLLGLGADGHTASLFSLEDVERGEGLCAIPVPRSEGPDRVSVTPNLLSQVETLVFLVAGKDKREIVARLRESPEAVPAGAITTCTPHVELWVDGDACPND